ncbi:MFS transporter [Massilia frigida]|uniref:MFS transporter n=1 Tax=Massilia frigida TaxID=2609281 RepID=UPI0028044C03|nr:MFS transporter [Massilia frigida]
MSRLSLPMLLSYGLFGLPLAMVALPIYVYLPRFYSGRAGLSLALIGAVLLAARVAAAFIDPLLGWWIERGQGAYARYVALSLSLPLLLAGFVALFHPPVLGSLATMGWFLGALMLVYVGFSIATIAHQSWGAALTQAPAERARVTGVREACGLVGVVLAAAVTGKAGKAGHRQGIRRAARLARHDGAISRSAVSRPVRGLDRERRRIGDSGHAVPVFRGRPAATG